MSLEYEEFKFNANAASFVPKRFVLEDERIAQELLMTYNSSRMKREDSGRSSPGLSGSPQTGAVNSNPGYSLFAKGNPFLDGWQTQRG